MNRLIKACVPAAVALAVAGVAPAASADTIVPGVYQLFNHPDGNNAPPDYGLRLDELFDVSGGNDVFTFDFEADGAAMFLEYDDVAQTIHIYGTAFGGRDTGSGYDSNWTSFVEIDFTYSMVDLFPGDDDLAVFEDGTTNSGTIKWLDTGETIDLQEKADESGLTFRFGDESDDNGHRGFDGLSGWGWLMHGPNGTTGNASDWLFTAVLIPLPAPVAMGLLGLTGVAFMRRRRAA